MEKNCCASRSAADIVSLSNPLGYELRVRRNEPNGYVCTLSKTDRLVEYRCSTEPEMLRWVQVYRRHLDKLAVNIS